MYVRQALKDLMYAILFKSRHTVKHGLITDTVCIGSPLDKSSEFGGALQDLVDTQPATVSAMTAAITTDSLEHSDIGSA